MLILKTGAFNNIVDVNFSEYSGNCIGALCTNLDFTILNRDTRFL